MSNILLLSLTDPATGNATTAGRIRGYLESAGCRVVHRSSAEEWTSNDLKSLVQNEHIVAAIGVHTFGAGRHLHNLGIPFAIVFGGTDLNELPIDAKAMAVMSNVVNQASVLVAFDDTFVTRATELWPQTASKLRRIPQAPMVHASSYSLRRALSLADQDILVLLPSGLRSVKDPLFCARMFADWHAKDARIHLAIVGAARDVSFAEHVTKQVATMPGVHIVPALAQHDLHAAMREAAVVLNTSKSESCPNAVLEAMALGTPVVVRNIPGNRSIVSHGETGFLFSTPEECREQVASVLQHPSLARSRSQAAQACIESLHQQNDERAAYLRVLGTLLGNG